MKVFSQNTFSLFLLFSITNASLYSQEVDHYETIVLPGSECRYLIPTSDIGDSWHSLDFNDSLWSTGISGVGYGDDDGFVAYINGTEVARANVPDPVSWNMELAVTHEATLYQGGIPESFILSSAAIQQVITEGINVLAIEVHNHNTSSSDLSSNMFLHVGLNVSSSYYFDVPEWFRNPVNFETFNLPVVIINTEGKAILDDPRIVAKMGIINNGPGILNRHDDPWNEYDGNISIEIRGESSQDFVKKSYTIELQNGDGSNKNVSIPGLPEENDFVLYAPYSDKTFLRNALVYKMYRKMDNWAPRTRFVELILNGEYRGVYLLLEKLIRDENRVDIDKLTPEDISPPDMLIINEVSKGIDNYMFSTYFYKQNDADGGDLFAGPPWDYNLSMGNLDYGYNRDIPETYNWVYNNWSRVYWWQRLLHVEKLIKQE